MQTNILELFEATGLEKDDFIQLSAYQEITENNLTQFVGSFEVIADKLIAQNEGVECSLVPESSSLKMPETSPSSPLSPPLKNMFSFINQIENIKVPSFTQINDIEDEMRQYTKKEFDMKAKKLTEHLLREQ